MTKQEIRDAINSVRDRLLLALHAAERDEFEECAVHLDEAVRVLETLPPERRAA